jgi:hypothetical protein
MNKFSSISRLFLCALAIPQLHDFIQTGLRGRWMTCFHCVCQWLSLPLSIWLCSGWVGLLLNVKVLFGPEFPSEQLFLRQKSSFKSSRDSEGDFPRTMFEGAP